MSAPVAHSSSGRTGVAGTNIAKGPLAPPTGRQVVCSSAAEDGTFPSANDLRDEFATFDLLPLVQRKWLEGEGIDVDDDLMRFARVALSGRYFDAVDDDENGVEAILILAHSADAKPSDIVAYVPLTGKTAVWLGREFALGFPLRRGFTSTPVLVHRDPLAWLAADRHGLALLDIKRASSWLANCGSPLAVTEPDFGRSLRTALTIEPPAILLAVAREQAV